MMKTLLTLLICSISLLGSSQKIIEATSQGWAGGVCCVTGTDYRVQISIKNVKDWTIQETWLKGKSEPLNGQYFDLPNLKNQAEIFFNTSKNGALEIKLDKEEKEEKKEKIRKPSFEGAALIILKNEDKTVRIEVEKFEILQFLAYP